jgi:UDP-N-acetyl-D-mannosaminuronate dehydrogenase
VSAADAVVLMVAHDAFDLSLVTDNARYVLDTRHCLHGSNVESL